MCRHCGKPLTLPFLDLGSAPPSNAYLDEPSLTAPETWFPLTVLACEHCWLVQTVDYAGREALFAKDYAYFSSVSTTWLDHARRYVGDMIARFDLNADSLVAEIAANDGYLLQYVREAGIPAFGVEPTRSTAAAARARGIDVVEAFFGVETARQLVAQGRRADLIAANNVLAHVPDINNFVAGFSELLADHGVATFEFPHLLRMIEQHQFDTVYHEHYSYLSLTAVQRIFQANGLAVFDVDELTTHGGSLRVYAQRRGGKQAVLPRVAQVLEAERLAGLTTPVPYRDFQSKAEEVKLGLLRFLVDARQNGQRVGAYGAAAKGNTLLNFAGVRGDLLPYVVDRGPGKVGRFLPGSRIAIVPEEHLRADRPDLILILPWNLTDEIVDQLAYARAWGARFVTAVPELTVR